MNPDTKPNSKAERDRRRLARLERYRSKQLEIEAHISRLEKFLKI